MELKKFENFDDELLDFDEPSKEELIDFFEACEKYIKGQNVQTVHSSEIIFENGYSYQHHGGGCSGEDCNTTWIYNPDGKIIAKEDW